MNIVINHNLPKERAFKCAENLFKNLAEKFKDDFSDLKQEIKADTIMFSLNVRGMTIKGNITVAEKIVTIESKLPLPLKMFQGILENKIYEHAEKEIAKC
jgi:hypothetical protein